MNDKKFLVKLNMLELLIGSMVGMTRHLLAKKRSLVELKKAPDLTSIDINVNGAIYEMAFAKWLNVYWDFELRKSKTGKVLYKAPDVAGYQVRGTEHLNGRLIYRQRDAKNEPYVLVVGSYFKYNIKGWMMGSEIVRHDEWINNPHGRGKCWMVPQPHLNMDFGEKENK